MGGLYMLDVFVSLNIIIITLRVLLSSDARHRQRWQKVLASHQILGFIAILYIMIMSIIIIAILCNEHRHHHHHCQHQHHNHHLC